MVRPPNDWKQYGACYQQGNQEDFFVLPGGTTAGGKAVCGRCEIRAVCYAWSLHVGEEYGVWGGVDEEDRRCDIKGECHKCQCFHAPDSCDDHLTA